MKIQNLLKIKYFEINLEVCVSCTYLYRMAKKTNDGKVRKEIKLHQSIIDLLEVGAKRKEWSLKRYMENVLFRDAKKQVPYS